MKTLSTAQLAAVAGEHVTACYLVQLEFASGTIYVTDAAHDIVWNGNTYLGAGRAGNIEATRETVAGEATGLRFSLAGPIASYLSAALAEHVQGKPAKVYVAFFADNGALIDTPVLEWSGLTDVMPVQEGADQSVISVTAESRFAQFARPRQRRHSDQDQQLAYPGDLFFQFAAQMIDRPIVWPSREWYRVNT